MTSLFNGDQIFSAMLAAIRTASRSITFETYIYSSGTIGREFAEALAERARAGVRVYILLDSVGSSKLDAAAPEMMDSAGVEIEWYRWPIPTRLVLLDRHSGPRWPDRLRSREESPCRS